MFLQGTWQHEVHFSREAKERDALVVSAFSPISILEYGNDHPSVPIFRWPSRTPGHTTHTSQSKNSSIQGFEHFTSDFTTACSRPSL